MATSPGVTTDKHPAKVTGPQAHERLCANDPRTVSAPDHVYVVWAAAIFESKFASVQDKNAAAERIVCARSTAHGRANSRCVGPTQLPAGSRKGRRPSPIFGRPPGEPSRNGRLLDRWANSVLKCSFCKTDKNTETDKATETTQTDKNTETADTQPAIT